ncbi:MAG: hypothetical protein KJN63_01090, partial [Acidimicrobiia bacterium]|nr:hypothetical protein [Acidimicrobiia bacterium]
MAYDISELVNLDIYPIHDPHSAGYVAAVDRARSQLADTGCALNKNFVRPDALELLAEEIEVNKPDTHFSVQSMNPYFHTELNPDYQLDHPVNTFIERSSGFIPGDSWEPGCANDVLFRAPEVGRFLAECLSIPALYCYADPLAGLTSNI